MICFNDGALIETSAPAQSSDLSPLDPQERKVPLLLIIQRKDVPSV